MKTIEKYLIIMILLAVSIGNLQAANNETSDLTGKVLGIFKQLENTKNYVKTLSMYKMESLPVGISRTLGNVEYSVAISSYRYKVDHAELTIYGRISAPQKELFFGAQGIKFSHEGDFIGETKLLLLKDESIPFGSNNELILHGGFDKITGAGIENKIISFFTKIC